jgi:hypothetical protein
VKSWHLFVPVLSIGQVLVVPNIVIIVAFDVSGIFLSGV